MGSPLHPNKFDARMCTLWALFLLALFFVGVVNCV